MSYPVKDCLLFWVLGRDFCPQFIVYKKYASIVVEGLQKKVFYSVFKNYHIKTIQSGFLSIVNHPVRECCRVKTSSMSIKGCTVKLGILTVSNLLGPRLYGLVQPIAPLTLLTACKQSKLKTDSRDAS